MNDCTCPPRLLYDPHFFKAFCKALTTADSKWYQMISYTIGDKLTQRRCTRLSFAHAIRRGQGFTPLLLGQELNLLPPAYETGALTVELPS